MRRKIDMITLYEKEPAGSRPVARAAGGGVPPGRGWARCASAWCAERPRPSVNAEIREETKRLIRVAETLPAVPVPSA